MDTYRVIRAHLDRREAGLFGPKKKPLSRDEEELLRNLRQIDKINKSRLMDPGAEVKENVRQMEERLKQIPDANRKQREIALEEYEKLKQQSKKSKLIPILPIH